MNQHLLSKAMLWSEVRFTFSRSSGGGGQNVNKVNTKASLTWNLNESQMLSPGHKNRFIQRYQNRLKDGVLSLSSQVHRTQAANKKQCVENLWGLLQATRYPPKKRIKTLPSRKAIQDRLKDKKKISQKKQERQKVEF